jgi:predicted nucleic acid-binding Zn ribbon protein
LIPCPSSECNEILSPNKRISKKHVSKNDTFADEILSSETKRVMSTGLLIYRTDQKYGIEIEKLEVWEILVPNHKTQNMRVLSIEIFQCNEKKATTE